METSMRREASIIFLLHTLMGDQTHNSGMYPDWKSNWQPLGAWVIAQPWSHSGRAFIDFLNWASLYVTNINLASEVPIAFRKGRTSISRISRV